MEILIENNKVKERWDKERFNKDSEKRGVKKWEKNWERDYR